MSMRNILLILTLLSFQVALLAQSNIFYTVQIGTFLDAKKSDFADLKSFGFVYAEPVNNNLSEVYVGNYETRAAAQKMVNKLADQGYTNAFAQERFLGDGQTVAVIQIATRTLKQKLEWERFLKVSEDLYTIINEDKVKIIAGIYNDVAAAKKELPSVQNNGFKDAFIKKVNTVFLHPIGRFELEGVKQPLIPIVISDNPDRSPRNSNIPANIPTSANYTDQPFPGEVTRPRSPNISVPSYNESSNLPKIRTKVKRTSALELQKLLKQEGLYKSSLDGYYGKGTSQSYERMKKQNREFLKYSLLAKHMQMPDQSDVNLPLQNILTSLTDQQDPITALDSYKHPMAKAYKAYLLFYNYGPSTEVNFLMNSALRGLFTGGIAPAAPVNPDATYAYNDMNQIVLHLLYMHSAPKNPYVAPCWLFAVHPRETAYANNQFAQYPDANFPTQNCGQFSSWEDARILQAIALDLNADKKLNTLRLARDATRRSYLYMSPAPLSNSDMEALMTWDKSLWKGLNGWASRDPLNKNTLTALKAAYFQTYVLLEDFYMDKGLKASQAKGLALATLQTMVGYHLERFIV